MGIDVRTCSNTVDIHRRTTTSIDHLPLLLRNLRDESYESGKLPSGRLEFVPTSYPSFAISVKFIPQPAGHG